MTDVVPGFEAERRVVQLAVLGEADEGDVMRLVAAAGSVAKIGGSQR